MLDCLKMSILFKTVEKSSLTVLIQSLLGSTEKIPENLILDINLKNQSANNQKAIPETPATIFLQQGSLCKEGFKAPESIWAHVWPSKAFSITLQFGFYWRTIHRSIYIGRH